MKDTVSMSRANRIAEGRVIASSPKNNLRVQTLRLDELREADRVRGRVCMGVGVGVGVGGGGGGG